MLRRNAKQAPRHGELPPRRAVGFSEDAVSISNCRPVGLIAGELARERSDLSLVERMRAHLVPDLDALLESRIGLERRSSCLQRGS